MSVLIGRMAIRNAFISRHHRSHFYHQQSSGHILLTIVYNVEQVAEAGSNALLILLRELALAVGLVVVMFVISWRLILLFVVLGPVLVWVIKITSSRMLRLSGDVQKTVGDIIHVAEESIDSASTEATSKLNPISL
ncbi:MAG: ABC transporter transmembrane domain-containing protein [Coxiellaceae bacterium]|nr:ABC transporter transmembrane domain-containing protein [Coxiellaceae bacterium]